MATGVKLPTGGRRRRRTSELSVVVGAVPRELPAAPPGMDAEDVELWDALWSEPSASLWRPGDGALVSRLILLRRRIEDEGASAPVALYGATLALESSLLLTPRARAGRGSAPPATPVVGDRPGQRIAARDRDRMLRG